MRGGMIKQCPICIEIFSSRYFREINGHLITPLKKKSGSKYDGNLFFLLPYYEVEKCYEYKGIQAGVYRVNKFPMDLYNPDLFKPFQIPENKEDRDKLASFVCSFKDSGAMKYVGFINDIFGGELCAECSEKWANAWNARLCDK